MGPTAYVEVHKGWREPVIVWTVLMAHKGLKKSPVLGKFISALSKLEQDIDESDDNEVEDISQQHFVEHFSMEELHYTMKRSGGRILAVFDELGLMFEQLDRYKGGQGDRKTLLSLINGSCWKQNYRSSKSFMKTMCYNMTEFVQSSAMMKLASTDADDGLVDRFLVACPAPMHCDYHEYEPLPAEALQLHDLFTEIHCNNPGEMVYTLDREAHEAFVYYHDAINK